MDEQPYVSVPEPLPPPPQPTLAMQAPAADGLTDNLAGALAYVTIIPAILFLVLEPYNRKQSIRFNAFQCLFLALTGFVINLFVVIPLLGWILVPLADLALIVVWVLCVIKAYSGTPFRLPVLGDISEKLAAQTA